MAYRCISPRLDHSAIGDCVMRRVLGVPPFTPPHSFANFEGTMSLTWCTRWTGATSGALCTSWARRGTARDGPGPDDSLFVLATKFVRLGYIISSPEEAAPARGTRFYSRKCQQLGNRRLGDSGEISRHRDGKSLRLRS